MAIAALGLAVTADALELGSRLAVGCYFTCLLVLVLHGLHRLWLMTAVWGRRVQADAEGSDPSDLPIVTVQCPIFEEPEVAVRLLDAVCALDYPRNRLEVQVLDDSRDETTSRLAEAVARHRAAGTDVHLLHRDDREGFKAGALEAGLHQARGELIAIFDADFVPDPDFLRRALPAFADPRVGMVQARWGHLNRQRSWFTKVQALLLDGHFLIEHAARSRRGQFFNFNGTAGIFRRACIEDAGGWQHDTLTEDLDLSYRAQLAGWRFDFVEQVQAPAELPTDVNAWKGQQRRWTTGAVQTARKLLPRILREDLPLSLKLEAILHLTANSAYPLLLLLALTTFPAAMARRAWGWSSLAAFEVPVLLLTTGVVCGFYLLAARRQGHRLPLTVLPRLLAVGVGASLNNTRAVLSGLRREVGVFVRTPKTGDRDGAPAAQGPGLAADTWSRLEVALGVLLSAQVLAAAWWGYWATVPVLVLFALGFLAVGFSSLRHARQLAAAA
ncbi:MAG: glycosyltransferase [Acidobacteriota bacterium]